MIASVSAISLLESFGGEALNKAAAKLGIPRRAAQALALMVALDGPMYTNLELQKLFADCKLSTELSAPKEASICKSVLLAGGYIETRGKVSTVAVTKRGHRAVATMDEHIRRVLEAKTVDWIRPILSGTNDAASVLRSGSERSAGRRASAVGDKPFVVKKKSSKESDRAVSFNEPLLA